MMVCDWETVCVWFHLRSLSGITCSGGSQLSSHEDIQTPYGKAMCEELWFPLKGQKK